MQPKGVPGGMLEEMLKEAKEEMGINPRLLNAHMQAITNGYNISMHINGQHIRGGGQVNCLGLINDARMFSTAIYEDYKKALEESKIEKSN